MRDTRGKSKHGARVQQHLFTMIALSLYSPQPQIEGRELIRPASSQLQRRHPLHRAGERWGYPPGYCLLRTLLGIFLTPLVSCLADLCLVHSGSELIAGRVVDGKETFGRG